MTVFELLINKKLNGVCDYSAQSLDYISKRVAIYQNETIVNDFAKVARKEVIDFFVEENNRIVIYV